MPPSSSNDAAGGFARHKRAAALARFLGPWADDASAPVHVKRATERLDHESGAATRAYRYEPTAVEVRGVYLVVQGLHYEGPEDPRLDRFCRVLAGAGFIVIAPFVETYLRLVMAADASRDVARGLARAHEVADERQLPNPAIFSISFGSTPAIEVAARAEVRDRLGALVVFGGFCDFFATIRFAVSGRAFDGGRALDLPHDPVNGPAVFINLLPLLDVPGDPSALHEAWLAMARATWGKRHLWAPAKRRAIADRLSTDLGPEQRALFLEGCGLAPGAPAVLEAALTRAGDGFAFANPIPHLPSLRAPVIVAHGRDDDVIPYNEAEKLHRALPASLDTSLLLTGMYGHTGAALPDLEEVVDEVRGLTDVLYAMADAPLGITTR